MVDFKKSQRGQYAKLLKDGYQTKVTQPDGSVVVKDVPPRARPLKPKPKGKVIYCVTVLAHRIPQGILSSPILGVYTSLKAARYHFEIIMDDRQRYAQYHLLWGQGRDDADPPAHWIEHRALISYIIGKEEYQEEIRLEAFRVMPSK